MNLIVASAILAVVIAVLRRYRQTSRLGYGRRYERVMARLRLGTLAARAGWTPSFGYLQLAAIEGAAGLRTVSVTGEVWVPSGYEIEMCAEDLAVVSHLPVEFGAQIAAVITSVAHDNGWRLDSPATVHVVESCTAPPGGPCVQAASWAAQDKHEVYAPVVEDPGDRQLRLRSTEVMTDRTADGGGTPELSPTLASPGLRLEPVGFDGFPIKLGSADDGIVVGRAADVGCHVRRPSISRKHCRLSRMGETWVIQDLGSSNGTAINGKRIITDETLREGDLVGLGGQTMYRVFIASEVRAVAYASTGS